MESEMMTNETDLKKLHPVEILRMVADHDPNMEFKVTSEGYSIRYLQHKGAKPGIDLTVEVYHTFLADAATVRKAWEVCGEDPEYFLEKLYDVKCAE